MKTDIDQEIELLTKKLNHLSDNKESRLEDAELTIGPTKIRARKEVAKCDEEIKKLKKKISDLKLKK